MRVHTITLDPSTALPSQLANAGIEDSDRLLLQLFSTSTKAPFVQGILRELKALLPSARLVGCTSTALLDERDIHEERTVLLACSFAKTQVEIASTRLRPEDRPNWAQLGRQLARTVVQPVTRLLLVYATAPLLNAEDLARGLAAENPQGFVAGQLAWAPQGEWPRLFCEDAVFACGVVVVALTGADLHVELEWSPDWMLLGTPLEVTEARSNIVKSINRLRATELYSRYIGFEACKEIPACSARFPLLMERDGMVIARPAKAVLPDGGVALWGNLNGGDTVRFGILNPAEATEHTNHLLSELRHKPVELILLYSSVARKVLMRSLTLDQYAHFATCATTLGVFSVGQFFYTPEHPAYLLYTQVMLSLGEGPKGDTRRRRGSRNVGFSQDTMEMRALSHLVSTTAKELEEANRALERMANTDSLTSIYNRHKAQRVLDQEFRRAQRYGRPLAFILFDLDDFKQINDQFGHAIGDATLTRVAAVVAPLVRDTDCFARWGGEEFVIVCPETNEAGAREIGERIRAAVAEQAAVENRPVTVSVGVTVFHPEDTLEKLVSRADRAMYLSKEKGKNRVTYYG